MTRSAGLFGGTFDPVHAGHVELARQVLEHCHLHQIIFIPAASPPHKKLDRLTPFQHRAAMLALAIGDDKRMMVSDIENRLPPPSYTVDTLAALLKEGDGHTEYSFIIGLDAFLEIHTWKSFKKVINEIHFIVVSRPGYREVEVQDYILSLQYEKRGDHWYNLSSRRKIYYLHLNITDISSTEIRRRLGASLELPENVVDPAVLDYIKQHKLYTA